jgi:hypothetical protein
MIPKLRLPDNLSLAGVCLAATIFAGNAQGQDTPPQNQTPTAHTTQITFKFDRPVTGVPVPHYTIELRSDGTASYHAEIPAAQGPIQAVERSLTFTHASVKDALTAVQQLRDSKLPCASTAKNIADTGTKTLTMHDPDAGADFVCTYNYSENKDVVDLTHLFLGVEETLEAGRILDFKHRFDRLGLDAAMADLVAGVEAGRALELGNISGTLRSIAADTAVIRRARERAAALLERAKADASNGG